jgi:hypothetical protein
VVLWQKLAYWAQNTPSSHSINHRLPIHISGAIKTHNSVPSAALLTRTAYKGKSIINGNFSLPLTSKTGRAQIQQYRPLLIYTFFVFIVFQIYAVLLTDKELG